MVTPEAFPFAKTGGLADVCGALPVALAKLGCDVKVVIPGYRTVDVGRFSAQEVIPRESVPFAGTEVERSILHVRRSGVDWYFVHAPAYYHREHLYSIGNTDYEDNAERFTFFAQQALTLVKTLGWKPDIAHSHDWQAGLIPAYLRHPVKTGGIDTRHPFYAGIRTLHTIHNMAYHGQFPKGKFSVTGLAPERYSLDEMESWGKLNFLKGALVYADRLNTVSERYAQEIQSEGFGCGLEGVVRKRAADLTGILNGIDTSDWDPATDPALAANYGADDLSGKEQCKRALMASQSLEYRSGTPVLGIVGRLVAQKGMDLIADSIDDIVALGAQMVILGTGDPVYHTAFEAACEKHPESIAVNLTYNETLARQIEAGADIFLMPSRFEPCGLNQMYSLRYGCVPVVHATGGLADTVTDYNPYTRSGNGFSFDRYDARHFLATVRRALETFADRPRWQELMRTGMREDFSWERSAAKYRDLYEDMVLGR